MHPTSFMEPTSTFRRSIRVGNSQVLEWNGATRLSDSHARITNRTPGRADPRVRLDELFCRRRQDWLDLGERLASGSTKFAAIKF